MKKLFFLALALQIGLGVFAAAQTTSPHRVDLNWTSSDGGASFNVYRAPGACPTTAPVAFPATPAPFVKLNSAPVSTTSFSDTNVVPGTYCYIATELAGTQESNASNLAPAAVNPLAVVITVTVAR